MTKEEFAAQYSEQKTEEIKNLIKEAYLKGYEQGCLESTHSINYYGVEYVDLGLPSGTLWSKTSLQYESYGYKQKLFSYEETKNLQIPTVEQWEELCKYCHFFGHSIIGPNGQRIGYNKAPAGYWIKTLGEGCEKNQNMFWLRGEINEENNAPAMLYDVIEKRDNDIICKGASMHFIGFRLPVFLVKD